MIEWIEYSQKKPGIGEPVIVYRDIESKQTYVTIWSKTDELYADFNKITHWAHFNYPQSEGYEEKTQEAEKIN